MAAPIFVSEPKARALPTAHLAPSTAAEQRTRDSVFHSRTVYQDVGLADTKSRWPGEREFASPHTQFTLGVRLCFEVPSGAQAPRLCHSAFPGVILVPRSKMALSQSAAREHKGTGKHETRGGSFP